MTPAVSASWCLRSSDSRCSACLQGDRIGSSDLHLILCCLKEWFEKTVAFTSRGHTTEREANGCSLFGGSSMPGSELLLLRHGLHCCHLGTCVQSPVVTAAFWPSDPAAAGTLASHGQWDGMCPAELGFLWLVISK